MLHFERLAFAGTSVAGSADPAYFIGLNGGIGSLLDDGTHNGGLKRANMNASQPTWSTIYLSPPAAAGPFDVQADELRDLLYALNNPAGLGSTGLKAYDVSPGSPTYGQVVASSAVLGSTGFMERFGLSGDGTRAVSLDLLTGECFVIDTDPSSPGYMGVLGTPIVPSSGAFATPTNVAVNHDGTMAVITIQYGGSTPSDLARLDLTTLTFLDHNSVLAGVQNIGATSLPPAAMGSAAVAVEISSDGAFAVTCGFGGMGWAGRFDFDPSVPSTWSYTAYNPPAGLRDTWAVAISSDDQVVGIDTLGEVVFLDALSGVQTSVVTVSSLTNVYTLRIQ